MWKYIKEVGLPKKEGLYMISCISETWNSKNGIPYTIFGYYDTYTETFHNGEGYVYSTVYAWDYVVEPAEPLKDFKWRFFHVRKETTWRKIYEFIKGKKLTFDFNTAIEDEYYADISVLCDTEEENAINVFINKEYD